MASVLSALNSSSNEQLEFALQTVLRNVQSSMRIPTRIVQLVLQKLTSTDTSTPLRHLCYEILWSMSYHADSMPLRNYISLVRRDAVGADHPDVSLVALNTLAELSPRLCSETLLLSPESDLSASSPTAASLIAFVSGDSHPVLRCAAIRACLHISIQGYRFICEELPNSSPTVLFPSTSSRASKSAAAITGWRSYDHRAEVVARSRCEEIFRAVLAAAETKSLEVSAAAFRAIGVIFSLRVHAPADEKCSDNSLLSFFSGKRSYLMENAENMISSINDNIDNGESALHFAFSMPSLRSSTFHACDSSLQRPFLARVVNRFVILAQKAVTLHAVGLAHAMRTLTLVLAHAIDAAHVGSPLDPLPTTRSEHSALSSNMPLEALFEHLLRLILPAFHVFSGDDSGSLYQGRVLQPYTHSSVFPTSSTGAETLTSTHTAPLTLAIAAAACLTALQLTFSSDTSIRRRLRALLRADADLIGTSPLSMNSSRITTGGRVLASSQLLLSGRDIQTPGVGSSGLLGTELPFPAVLAIPGMGKNDLELVVDSLGILQLDLYAVGVLGGSTNNNSAFYDKSAACASPSAKFVVSKTRKEIPQILSVTAKAMRMLEKGLPQGPLYPPLTHSLNSLTSSSGQSYAHNEVESNNSLGTAGGETIQADDEVAWASVLQLPLALNAPTGGARAQAVLAGTAFPHMYMSTFGLSCAILVHNSDDAIVMSALPGLLGSTARVLDSPDSLSYQVYEADSTASALARMRVQGFLANLAVSVLLDSPSSCLVNELAVAAFASVSSTSPLSNSSFGSDFSKKRGLINAQALRQNSANATALVTLMDAALGLDASSPVRSISVSAKTSFGAADLPTAGVARKLLNALQESSPPSSIIGSTIGSAANAGSNIVGGDGNRLGQGSPLFSKVALISMRAEFSSALLQAVLRRAPLDAFAAVNLATKLDLPSETSNQLNEKSDREILKSKLELIQWLQLSLPLLQRCTDTLSHTLTCLDELLLGPSSAAAALQLSFFQPWAPIETHTMTGSTTSETILGSHWAIIFSASYEASCAYLSLCSLVAMLLHPPVNTRTYIPGSATSSGAGISSLLAMDLAPPALCLSLRAQLQRALFTIGQLRLSVTDSSEVDSMVANASSKPSSNSSVNNHAHLSGSMLDSQRVLAAQHTYKVLWGAAAAPQGNSQSFMQLSTSSILPPPLAILHIRTINLLAGAWDGSEGTSMLQLHNAATMRQIIPSIQTSQNKQADGLELELLRNHWPLVPARGTMVGVSSALQRISTGGSALDSIPVKKNNSKWRQSVSSEDSVKKTHNAASLSSASLPQEEEGNSKHNKNVADQNVEESETNVNEVADNNGVKKMEENVETKIEERLEEKLEKEMDEPQSEEDEEDEEEDDIPKITEGNKDEETPESMYLRSLYAVLVDSTILERCSSLLDLDLNPPLPHMSLLPSGRANSIPSHHGGRSNGNGVAAAFPAPAGSNLRGHDFRTSALSVESLRQQRLLNEAFRLCADVSASIGVPQPLSNASVFVSTSTDVSPSSGTENGNKVKSPSSKPSFAPDGWRGALRLLNPVQLTKSLFRGSSSEENAELINSPNRGFVVSRPQTLPLLEALLALVSSQRCVAPMVRLAVEEMLVHTCVRLPTGGAAPEVCRLLAVLAARCALFERAFAASGAATEFTEFAQLMGFEEDAETSLLPSEQVRPMSPSVCLDLKNALGGPSVFTAAARYARCASLCAWTPSAVLAAALSPAALQSLMDTQAGSFDLQASKSVDLSTESLSAASEVDSQTGHSISDKVVVKDDDIHANPVGSSRFLSTAASTRKLSTHLPTNIGDKSNSALLPADVEMLYVTMMKALQSTGAKNAPELSVEILADTLTVDTFSFIGCTAEECTGALVGSLGVAQSRAFSTLNPNIPPVSHSFVRSTDSLSLVVLNNLSRHSDIDYDVNMGAVPFPSSSDHPHTSSLESTPYYDLGNLGSVPLEILIGGRTIHSKSAEIGSSSQLSTARSVRSALWSRGVLPLRRNRLAQFLVDPLVPQNFVSASTALSVLSEASLRLPRTLRSPLYPLLYPQAVLSAPSDPIRVSCASRISEGGASIQLCFRATNSTHVVAPRAHVRLRLRGPILLAGSQLSPSHVRGPNPASHAASVAASAGTTITSEDVIADASSGAVALGAATGPRKGSPFIGFTAFHAASGHSSTPFVIPSLKPGEFFETQLFFNVFGFQDIAIQMSLEYRIFNADDGVESAFQSASTSSSTDANLQNNSKVDIRTLGEAKLMARSSRLFGHVSAPLLPPAASIFNTSALVSHISPAETPNLWKTSHATLSLASISALVPPVPLASTAAALSSQPPLAQTALQAGGIDDAWGYWLHPDVTHLQTQNQAQAHPLLLSGISSAIRPPRTGLIWSGSKLRVKGNKKDNRVLPAAVSELESSRGVLLIHRSSPHSAPPLQRNGQGSRLARLLMRNNPSTVTVSNTSNSGSGTMNDNSDSLPTSSTNAAVGEEEDTDEPALEPADDAGLVVSSSARRYTQKTIEVTTAELPFSALALLTPAWSKAALSPQMVLLGLLAPASRLSLLQTILMQSSRKSSISGLIGGKSDDLLSPRRALSYPRSVLSSIAREDSNLDELTRKKQEIPHDPWRKLVAHTSTVSNEVTQPIGNSNVFLPFEYIKYVRSGDVPVSLAPLASLFVQLPHTLSLFAVGRVLPPQSPFSTRAALLASLAAAAFGAPIAAPLNADFGREIRHYNSQSEDGLSGASAVSLLCSGPSGALVLFTIVAKCCDVEEELITPTFPSNQKQWQVLIHCRTDDVSIRASLLLEAPKLLGALFGSPAAVTNPVFLAEKNSSNTAFPSNSHLTRVSTAVEPFDLNLLFVGSDAEVAEFIEEMHQRKARGRIALITQTVNSLNNNISSGTNTASPSNKIPDSGRSSGVSSDTHDLTQEKDVEVDLKSSWDEVATSIMQIPRQWNENWNVSLRSIHRNTGFASHTW